MLNVFTLANGRLFQEEIESHEALAHVRPVWVDLDAPSEEEKGWITEHFGLTIPSDAVDDDLEDRRDHEHVDRPARRERTRRLLCFLSPQV